MTVYNITRLRPHTAEAVATVLGVTKVELRYSDWLNGFGVHVKNSEERDKVSPMKRKSMAGVITRLFADVPMQEILKCPVVKRNKD